MAQDIKKLYENRITDDQRNISKGHENRKNGDISERHV
jgi:hypothetical protein